MKQFRLFFLLTLLSACALALLTPGVGAWEITLRDFPRSSGRAGAVVIDATGDVISAGSFPSFGVVKASGATGEVKWRYSPGISQTPLDVAVDSNGDVFVVETSRGVTKLSGVDGTLIWSKGVGGTANAFQSYLHAVKVDGRGDVLTAGSVGGLFNVAKLDGRTGEQKWHYEREGYAKAVAVDPSGNVAAAGVSNKNFAVVKLRGSDGQELWERELNGVGTWTDVFEEANAVAVDSDGSVVAAGNTSNIYANDSDFTVVKYGPGGALRWKHALDGGFCRLNDRGEKICTSSDRAYAVALGGDGSVFAAGSMQTDADQMVPGANEHVFVAKFSEDGASVWGQAAEAFPPAGREYTRGRAVSIAVDAAGNAFAAGQHDERFTVVKFTGGGSRQWLRQPGLAPTQGNHSTALEVVTDAENNVVVAGETLAEDQFSLFTVVKLRGVDGSDYFGGPRPDVPETVIKYAPLVYLHPEDEFRPADPLEFIRRSELRWSHQATVVCGDHTVAARGEIDAERLGRGTPYTHNPRSQSNLLCHREDIALTARDHTRPFDGAERDNVLGQEDNYLREGFFLDPENDDGLRRGVEERPGAPSYGGVPVFYEYVPYKYVTYWFFYPYNEYRFLTSVGQEVGVQFHEGDWERISIQLDSEDLPVNIFYYGHEGGSIVPWGTVDVYEGTHPIVFSAKGSHASYPEAGLHPTMCLPEVGCVNDYAASGPSSLSWVTWHDIRDVMAQPWYGFGGAWGELGEYPFTPLSSTHYTGPLGPSPYKTSRSKWFPGISGRVTDAQGRVGSGVVLTLSEQGHVKATTTTGQDGRYSFVDLTFGRSYAISPSKEGFSFNPAVRAFSDLRENQTANFITRDLIPPALSLPADITVDAYVPQGATVHYDVTAIDNVTTNPRTDCGPPPGALFNVGSTTVTCTASDEDGNTSSGSFKVTVRGAVGQLTDLLSVIRQLNLKKGDEDKLIHELEQALKASALGQTRKACHNLEQFETKVRRETRKGLTAGQATQLITAAARISTVIGCR